MVLDRGGLLRDQEVQYSKTPVDGTRSTIIEDIDESGPDFIFPTGRKSVSAEFVGKPVDEAVLSEGVITHPPKVFNMVAASHLASQLTLAFHIYRVRGTFTQPMFP